MSPGRPELLALLAAAKERPEARLVLADWLEEQPDEVDRARGEFVRVGVALAAMGTDDPGRLDLERRQAALRSRHEAAWLGPLREAAYGWDFRSGLLRLRLDSPV